MPSKHPLTSNVTCLKILPNENMLFRYTVIAVVMYYKHDKSTSKQTYPRGTDFTSRSRTLETEISLTYLLSWLLKVHLSANMPCKYGVLSIRSLSCPDPRKFCYATASYKRIRDKICHLKVSTGPFCRNNDFIKSKIFLRQLLDRLTFV